MSHHHSECSHGGCGCAHSHHHHDHHGNKSQWTAPVISFVMLMAGLVFGWSHCAWFTDSFVIRLIWYIAAFLPVGLPVLKEAAKGIASGDIFNEFTLMSIACIGAFCIRELPEAVGVMLFYTIGETLQHGAVDRATRDISRLVDMRGESALLIRGDKAENVKPQDVHPGDIIEVRPGQRVPLDGVLLENEALFDTSALTGESIPRELTAGDEVLAGMISSRQTVRIRVIREHGSSALSRILDMVEHASYRKAHAELFIRRFARIYTPAVIVLAGLIVSLPAIVAWLTPSFHYIFAEWLYRALVFLVISCPCALVISVPLGYFAGIGAASRRGILFKGGNYLEALRRVNMVAFDKTGTLTTGSFTVGKVVSAGMENRLLLALMAGAEAQSGHPLAKALYGYAASQGINVPDAEEMKEIPGYGATAKVAGRKVVAGNLKLLKAEGIDYPEETDPLAGTIIACGVDGKFAGYVIMSDTLKPDAAETVSGLRNIGIEDVIMLSGDKKEIVADFASRLGIKEAYGELLPQDKAEYVERMASAPGRSIAFVGDGMNDAPVLALSNVGVAMGALGSDAAIESADVVIQTDNPVRLLTAIRIGRFTHTIVMENIVGAIGIKVMILTLGALGYASLWAAVFADVGVALLAVLNSMRILWRKY